MSNGEFFRRVNDAALDRFDSVMAWLGLEGGKRSGPEYLPLNPRRGDHTPGSFSINTATGAWADFADDAKGGDLVSLVAYLQGLKQLAAADALADYLGLPARPGKTDAHNRAIANAGASGGALVSGTPNKTRHDATQKASEPPAVCVMPVPDDAPPPPKAHSRHGAPAACYAYHDAAGRVNFYHYRFEPKGERKQFSPVTLWRLPSGVMRWQFKAPPDPRPIYGLDLLTAKPDAQVVIVEGEKARAAAEMLLPDAIVICWQGGAQAVSKADWRALAGRAVILWPDADEPGKACMDKLAVLLQHAGAISVHRVRLDRLALDAGTDESNSPTLTQGAPLANGDDAADMMARGWSAAHVALIWPKAGASYDGGILFDALAEASQTTTDERYEPLADGVPKRFVLNSNGLHTLKDGDPVWFAQPLEVITRCRDPHGTGWAKLVVFHNPDGQEKREVIPDTMLAGDGAELERYFRAHGFNLAPNGRQLLRQYLIESNPAARARIVKTTGWHQAGQSDPVYVLPSRTFGVDGEQWLYDVTGDPPKHFAARGTLTEWRDNVAALCVGNTRLVFAVSAAYAAPLLYLTKDESGGFHLAGNSSDGKTSVLVAASSVSGPPRENVQRWRTTDNSLEGTSARYCDSLLPLDDIGQADSKAMGQIVYMLGNGSGKNRMTDQAGMRQTLKWRLLFFSTGEVYLETRMAEAGQKPYAGQEIRMAEMPADAGAKMGVFENIHGSETPEVFARRVVDVAQKYYGTPLLAWLEYLATTDQFAIVDHVNEAASKFIETQLTGNAHGQAKRVARRFALVGAAGELATLCGITGWQQGEAMRAARRCFKDWLDRRGGEADQEQRAMLQQVRAFIEQHGNARFEDVDRVGDSHAPRVMNRAGYRQESESAEGGPTFYILPNVWKNEVCKGYDATSVARLMRANGWLVGKEGEQKRTPRTQVTLKDGSRPWVMHVTPGFMAADI